jgi:branched-chain amino acid transport system substrate-binding protein
MMSTRRKILKSALMAGVVMASGPLYLQPAAAEDTIKIGASFSVTGGQSSIDSPALNGAKLKAEEINAAGGVLGKKIELVIYDTKTDPTVIASSASQLINQDKVVAGVGLDDSDAVLALGPIFQAAGVPFVTPGATSPKLPDQVGSTMFLGCFGDNVQAAAGAEFVLNTLNGKSVYLLRDNATEYTTLLAKFFQEAYEHAGGKIVLADDYKHGDTSFTAQITKLKALAEKPDVLYVAAQPDDIGVVVKQIRQAGLEQPIVGGDGYDTPLLLSVGGKAANNVYFTTHAFMAENSTEGIVKFYNAYKAAYNTVPENAFAALGYDTVGLVADAIGRAGVADPAKIRDALAATQGYKGITGSISYGPDSRVPNKTVSIIGVKDEKLYLAGEITPTWVAKP